MLGLLDCPLIKVKDPMLQSYIRKGKWRPRDDTRCDEIHSSDETGPGESKEEGKGDLFIHLSILRLLGPKRTMFCIYVKDIWGVQVHIIRPKSGVDPMYKLRPHDLGTATLETIFSGEKESTKEGTRCYILLISITPSYHEEGCGRRKQNVRSNVAASPWNKWDAGRDASSDIPLTV